MTQTGDEDSVATTPAAPVPNDEGRPDSSALHDPARVQIEKYDAELKRLSVDAAAAYTAIEKAGRTSITAPIFHYTDAAGLLGILRSQCLWFTHALHMNDPSEIHHGMELARRLIQNPSHAIGAWESDNAIARESAVVLETLCRYLELRLSGATPIPFCLACFSKNGDDLDQWRAYGDDGRGFALGFAPSFFHGEAGLVTMNKGNIWLMDVEYDTATIEQTVTPSIACTVKAVMETMIRVGRSGVHRGAADIEYFGRKVLDTIAGALVVELMFHAIGTKNSAYKNETETRLIYLGAPTDFTNNLTRARGHALVSYIERQAPVRAPGNIVEIVIGPAAHQTAEDALKGLLASFGLQSSVRVRRSEIPYRSAR